MVKVESRCDMAFCRILVIRLAAAAVVLELLPLNQLKINKLDCKYVTSEQNFMKFKLSMQHSDVHKILSEWHYYCISYGP